MILKNFKNMLYAIRVTQSNNDTGTNNSWNYTGVTLKNLEGAVRGGYATRSDVDVYISLGSVAAGNNLAALGNGRDPGSIQSEWRWNHYTGSGTTDPTIDDYALETPNSGLTNLKTAVAISQDSGNYNIRTTFTCTGDNTSENSITINEIGIVKGAIVYNTSDAAWRHDNILIIREVLETPLVVPAGSGYRIILEMVENVT